MEYNAIIVKQDGCWIGWIPQVPGANAQEDTKEDLLISLKETAKDILELRREQVLSEISAPFEEISISL